MISGVQHRYEAEARGAGPNPRSIERAFSNSGVEFTPGAATGAGVRFVAGRPQIVRRPTTVSAWDGPVFAVKWKGDSVIVFVHREALDDLEHFITSQSDKAYLAAFNKHVGGILVAVAGAIENPQCRDRDGRLHLYSRDFTSLH